MEFELTISRKRRFARWVKARTLARLEYDHAAWRYASAGLLVLSSILAAFVALGMPTGLGKIIDVGGFVLANAMGLLLVSQLIAVLLSMFRLPAPRQFIGFFSYTALLVYSICYYMNFGVIDSIAFALIVSVMGSFAGIGIRLLLRSNGKGIALMTAAVFASGLLSALLIVTFGPQQPGQSSITEADSADGSEVTVLASASTLPSVLDPSRDGDYAYTEFTYGSGSDKHREGFGKAVDYVSEPADASAYIKRWNKLKEWYWGFNQKQLPINGTVWMPEGDGPFPITLMVHGNHLMEDFSDGGYRYLGELLASKGIIAVSVDENFLNYSVWSGIPDNDMLVRSWVLLKHLQQLNVFSETGGHALYSRIDWDRVALLGHSRGGQAVAMAADADKWFSDDKSLTGFEPKIKSVIALAPTDRKVNDKSAELQDVNYLTLQGARDADVNSFYGDRQYIRTSFTPAAGYFKASLYIAEANHSRFNTDWGTMDESMPGGLLLNQRGMLTGEEQRSIAQVYVSAFLEATLNDKAEYLPLFHDYRSGLAWLPSSTEYISRYEDATFLAAARYEEDTQKTTLPEGGKLEAEGLAEWTEEDAENRDSVDKGTKGAVLQWEEEGSYSLSLSESYGERLSELDLEQDVLSFSLVDLTSELETEKDAAEAESPAEDADGAETSPRSLPEIKVELVLEDGSSGQLPLGEVMSVPAPFEADYLKIPWLEKRIKDGKYEESAEPVFQTFRLPLRYFDWDRSPSETVPTEVIFHFTGGPGKIMLDDIGFSE
ncbi:alpha/beta hydrolase [Paenibacillus sp. NPDC058071]|uniref:alpha/beta hydrolase n=1 Tax=Paenibacillus sp. NPDC058071 TaxID=3346326 RepID=UPI0036DF43D8